VDSETRRIPTDRSAAARAVVQEVLRRRTAGDEISDADVLAAHEALQPELRQELRKLAVIQRAAQRHAHAGSSAAAGLPHPATPETGERRFPGYAVIREIARGGQGAVFEAIQDGTRRRVAIKLIHRGGGARDAARFTQEVRILAQLRHPNIVAIHESGSVGEDDYFVMDYVDGAPLDGWVAARVEAVEQAQASPRAVLREVLDLLATVAEAVHAAHLRGVIHRDLKPANIRVDGDGRPVVLDFGLAKRLASDVDDLSAAQPMTESGHFVGSLPWSSPEQAGGRTPEIDLRTDVYALGVMLYQSVTGRFPYEVRGPLLDVIGRILHDEPQSVRAASDSALAPLVDRDLEAIVLRCLAKPPPRRYQSAGDVAADLRRYLAGEAIDARRDSTWYVLRKTLRRHRIAAAVALGFVALSGASAVVFALQAAQIRVERDAAAAARDDEHAARMTSERVAGFLEELLASADPFDDPAHRRDVTLQEAVDLAAGRIEEEFAGEPRVEASVRTVIGRTYRELGALDAADAHLQRALALRRELLGSGHPSVAETLHEAAQLRQVQARYDDAEQLCSEALAIRLATFGDGSAEVAESRNLRAHLLRELDRLEEAEQEARAALAARRALLADDDPLIAESYNALAGVLRERKKLEEAEAAYVEALDRRRTLLRPGHPDVATSLNNLAALRCEQKRFADAIPLLEEALEIYVSELGEIHPYVARGRANLATALTEVGRTAEAEAQFRAALDTRRALAPDGDAESAALAFLLGQMLAREGRDADARIELESAVPLLRATRGIRDTLTRRATSLLTDVYERLGEAALADALRAESPAP